MYLSRLGSKKILTCITQYQGHLPRVFLFKPPPQRKKGAGVSMGTKILVRPRDAEPTERSFVIGLVEDPEINGIDPPPRRQSSTDPLIPFFRSSETERRFFWGGGRFKKIYEPPWWDFLRWGFFSSLGTTCWCCQRGVVGPFPRYAEDHGRGTSHGPLERSPFWQLRLRSGILHSWDLMVQKSPGQPPLGWYEKNLD